VIVDHAFTIKRDGSPGRKIQLVMEPHRVVADGSYIAQYLRDEQQWVIVHRNNIRNREYATGKDEMMRKLRKFIGRVEPV
jgi:hypothetical protein